MKKFLLIPVLFLSLSFFAQSEKFTEVWEFTKKHVAAIDSSCQIVNIQRLSFSNWTKWSHWFNSYKSKSVVSDTNSNRHKMVAMYYHGQNMIKHKYKSEGRKKIKIMELNGQIVSMRIRWYDPKLKKDFSALFIHNSANTWFFTYTANTKKEQLSEKVNNWAGKIF